MSGHIFSEHLLDREHYFDWIITSLTSASLDTLPIWLLFTQIYWPELLRTRRFGRHLSCVLLQKLHEASQLEHRELFSLLIRRVSHMVASLMRTNPENFVVPTTWFPYRDALRSSLDHEDDRTMACFAQIDRRNRRLVSSPRSRGPVESPEQRFLELLDSSHDAQHAESLLTACIAFHPDHPSVVPVLLDWMTSPFRQGIARVYLGVRVMRRWRKLGLDTDAAMLAFLTSRQNTLSSPYNIYLAVSELIRSRHFNVGTYLQWLIASGAMDNVRSLTPVYLPALPHTPC